MSAAQDPTTDGRPSVLVTGASRGIGRETAERLAGAGWQVFAGVRRAEDAPAGTQAVLLDVTDAAQIAALPSQLPSRLDALVNNAGVMIPAAVETTLLEDVRQQFDVNVVGQIAVAQAVLPLVRAAAGRIVFVSSVSGRISTPMTGIYNASKHAVEGLADALRVELRPWGIRVVLVEPGAVDTDIWRDMQPVIDASEAATDAAQRALYAPHLKGLRRATKIMAKGSAPARSVAGTIERALTAKRPRSRYVVGISNRIQVIAAALTPTPVMDFVLGLATGTPRRGKLRAR